MSGLEVVGVVASILQVADLGAKLSVKLCTFYRTVKVANRSLQSLSSDVSLTSSILSELGKTLEQDEQTKLCSEQAFCTAQQVLLECKAVFQRIEDAIEQHDTPGKKGRFMRGAKKVTVALLGPELDVLKGNLERLKSTTLLMLQVLLYAGQVRKTGLKSTTDQRSLIQTLFEENKADETESVGMIQANEPVEMECDDGKPLQNLTDAFSAMHQHLAQTEFGKYHALIQRILHAIDASQHILERHRYHRLRNGVVHVHSKEVALFQNTYGHAATGLFDDALSSFISPCSRTEKDAAPAFHVEAQEKSRKECRGCVDSLGGRNDDEYNFTRSCEVQKAYLDSKVYCDGVPSSNTDLSHNQVSHRHSQSYLPSSLHKSFSKWRVAATVATASVTALLTSNTRVVLVVSTYGILACHSVSFDQVIAFGLLAFLSVYDQLLPKDDLPVWSPHPNSAFVIAPSNRVAILNRVAKTIGFTLGLQGLYSVIARFQLLPSWNIHELKRHSRTFFRSRGPRALHLVRSPSHGLPQSYKQVYDNAIADTVGQASSRSHRRGTERSHSPGSREDAIAVFAIHPYAILATRSSGRSDEQQSPATATVAAEVSESTSICRAVTNQVKKSNDSRDRWQVARTLHKTSKEVISRAPSHMEYHGFSAQERAKFPVDPGEIWRQLLEIRGSNSKFLMPGSTARSSFDSFHSDLLYDGGNPRILGIEDKKKKAKNGKYGISPQHEAPPCLVRESTGFSRYHFQQRKKNYRRNAEGLNPVSLTTRAGYAAKNNFHRSDCDKIEHGQDLPGCHEHEHRLREDYHNLRPNRAPPALKAKTNQIPAPLDKGFEQNQTLEGLILKWTTLRLEEIYIE